MIGKKSSTYVWPLALLFAAGCATSEPPEQAPQVSLDEDQGVALLDEDMGSSATGDAGEDTTGDMGAEGPRTVEMGYVLEDCDPLGQDCADQGGERYKCVLANDGSGVCILAGEQLPLSAPCRGIHQCEPGLACVNWGDERGSRCEELCDATVSGAGGCGADQVCVGGVASNESFGLCEPAPEPCDIYEQDCEGGLSCVLGTDPVSGGLAQLCGETGPQRDGEPCGGEAGKCMRGMICVRLEVGADPQCAKVCEPPEEGQTTPCIDGQTCSGETVSNIQYCR